MMLSPRRLLVAAAVTGAIGTGVATVTARSQPVPEPPAQVIWPFVDFQTVPQLGDETVRGSGCGGAQEVPATIPDGVWAGQIDGFVDGGSATDDIGSATGLQFDLWCIYQGDAAAKILAAGQQTILLDNPAYLVVNNNERARGVNLDESFILRYAVRLVDGRCIDPGPAAKEYTGDDGLPYYRSAQTWLNIKDGKAVWAFVDCRD
ncbi:MAG: hypothetical protein V9E89_09990 [Ilumatobacteraceae bacterium]